MGSNKIVAVNDMRSACVQSQQHLFKKLFATLDDTEIWKCLQKGFSIALEQLRTLDVGKRAFCLHPMCLSRYSDVLKQMAFLQRLDRMWRITLSDRYYVAAMYNDYMLELYQKRKQMTSLL